MGEILPGKRGGSSLHLGVILGWRRYLYSVEIGYPNMVGNSGVHVHGHVLVSMDKDTGPLLISVLL